MLLRSVLRNRLNGDLDSPAKLPPIDKVEGGVRLKIATSLQLTGSRATVRAPFRSEQETHASARLLSAVAPPAWRGTT